MAIGASICSLPTNLCLKRSQFSSGGYEVWSLEDIPLGVRFGPYQQKFIGANKSKNKEYRDHRVQKTGDKIAILDDKNKGELNWLFHVNYAHQEEKSNLIIFLTELGLYYITCRQIPANTQLMAYDNTVDGIKGYSANNLGTTDVREADVLHIEKNYLPESHLGCDNREKQYLILKDKTGYLTICNMKRSIILCDKSHTGEYVRSKCNVYEKAFSLKSHLEEHKQIYSGTKPFKYDACRKAFSEKCSMEPKQIHNEVKPFKCNFCGKAFNRKHYLKKHEKLQHEEELFTGNECGKEFNLKGHEIIHTEEKPFKCNTCGKTFYSKDHLSNHEKIHSVTIFKCSTCGKKFAWKSSLKKFCDEKPFKCNTCGENFRDKYCLKKYKRNHSGEKPFECNTCGKKYIWKSDLENHESLHTGEKPFKCSTCGKAFCKKGNLKQHEKIHI